jgi:hypothetical protein
MFRVVFIALVVLFMGVPANSELPPSNGNELIENCKEAIKGDSDDFFKSGWCYGFLQGASEMFVMAKILGQLPPSYCMPAEVTEKQAVRIVMKYLQNHPEKLHYPRTNLVYRALAQAFPCDTQKTPK